MKPAASLRHLVVATLVAVIALGSGIVEAPRPVVAGVAPACTNGDTSPATGQRPTGTGACSTGATG